MATRRQHQHTKLPSFESKTYWLVCVPSVVFTFLYSIVLTNTHWNVLPQDSLETGMFGVHRDFWDFEWTDYRQSFIKLYAVSFVYSLVGNYVAGKFGSNAKIYYSIAGIILVGFITSLNTLALFGVVVLSFYAVFSVKNAKINAFLLLLFTILLHTDQFREPVFEFFSISDEGANIAGVALLMIILRLLSYSTEIISQPKLHNAIDYLCYIFYLPLFLFGPMLTYDLFAKDFFQPRPFTFSTTVKQLLRYLTLAACVDAFYHFSYVTLFASRHHILSNTFTVYECLCVGWALIVMFCVKYMVIYGLAGVSASVDGIEAPSPPHCICTLYTFIDMWRYFDQGLHRLLQRSIYIPVGGSRHGTARTALASFVCFAFVAVWHGNNSQFWCWGLTNFMGIFLEIIAKNLTSRLPTLVDQQSYRRLCAVGGTVSITFLLYSNLIYVTDFETANLIYGRIFSCYGTAVPVLVVFYSSVHVSIDLMKMKSE